MTIRIISEARQEDGGVRRTIISERVNVYLSARISSDAHAWNNTVCGLLDERFTVFKPQEHNPYNVDHRELELKVYEMDLEAMGRSDMGLLLPPYGRDCAWEVGWYSHSSKPLVVYVETDTGWLRDWMLKGGVDKVLTSQPWMYEILKNDPILGVKCSLLKSPTGLSDALIDLTHQGLWRE